MTAFVGLTFGLAWALWVPLAWYGVVVGPGIGWPSHLPGLVAPAIAALVVTAAREGREGVRELVSRVFRWRLVGPMSRHMAALIVLTLGCVLVPLLESPRPPWEAFLTYSGAPAIGLLVVPYVVLVNGIGEELGWRGYFVEGLLPRLGVARTALVTWAAWAAWHAPLFLIVDTFRGLGAAGTIGWLIGIGCGSLVLIWLYVASGRSVLLPAIWHGAYNFATATVAATTLSSALASGVVIAVVVGLVRHRAFWELPPSGWRQPRSERRRL